MTGTAGPLKRIASIELRGLPQSRRLIVDVISLPAGTPFDERETPNAEKIMQTQFFTPDGRHHLLEMKDTTPFGIEETVYLSRRRPDGYTKPAWQRIATEIYHSAKAIEAAHGSGGATSVFERACLMVLGQPVPQGAAAPDPGGARHTHAIERNWGTLVRECPRCLKPYTQVYPGQQVVTEVTCDREYWKKSTLRTHCVSCRVQAARDPALKFIDVAHELWITRDTRQTRAGGYWKPESIFTPLVRVHMLDAERFADIVTPEAKAALTAFLNSAYR